MSETRRMPYDWCWYVVAYAVCWPLRIVQMFAALVYVVAELVGEAASDGADAWFRRVRVWSGRTPDGLTPAMVAEKEAHRQRVLDEMRSPSSRA